MHQLHLSTGGSFQFQFLIFPVIGDRIRGSTVVVLDLGSKRYIFPSNCIEFNENRNFGLYSVYG